MWLPVQAQTALISALTAVVITMIVEYFAKPGLEARKDRILDTHRARRETATQLLNLTANLPNLYGLATPNPLMWARGKSALQQISEACGRLDEALPRYEFSLPKRQRRVVGQAIRAIGASTAGLHTLVMLYEGTGILDQEQERRVEKLPTGAFVESATYNALYETARAYTALMLTRRRPLKYHLQLRRLAKGAPPLSMDPSSGEQPTDVAEERSAD